MVVFLLIVGSKHWPLKSVELLAEWQGRLSTRPGHGKCGCPGGPTRGFGKSTACRPRSIIAVHCDERDLGAGSTGRHGLIGALAAGRGRERVS